MTAWAVARELGLDSGRLKRKMKSQETVRSRRCKQVKPGVLQSFVEMGPVAEPSRIPWTQGSGPLEPVLEVERRDGTRLRLYPQAIRGQGVIELMERFIPSSGG